MKKNPMDNVNEIVDRMLEHAEESRHKAFVERMLLVLSLLLVAFIACGLTSQPTKSNAGWLNQVKAAHGEKVSVTDVKDPVPIPVYTKSATPKTKVPECGITKEIASKPPQKVYITEAEITHYTYNSAEEASGDRITATGLKLTPENLAVNCATHWSKVPPGSRIELPTGEILKVTDRIPESTRQHNLNKILIDRPVLTKDIAIKEGRKHVKVKVYLP